MRPGRLRAATYGGTAAPGQDNGAVHGVEARKRFFLKKEAKTFFPFYVLAKCDQCGRGKT
jgi:hypothetical protein